MADEVAGLVAQYRPDQLWYADDVFTLKHSWLFEYARELERRSLRVPFEFLAKLDMAAGQAPGPPVGHAHQQQ